MRTHGHDGARDDYRDYAKAPRNWYLRNTRPRRSLRAVSKPSILKAVKTPELTHLFGYCSSVDPYGHEYQYHSNKAKAVQPAKLTQFATEHLIRLWEWDESKMEDGPQIHFPRPASNIGEASASMHKHTWTILNYVIIPGTLVPLLTLACSVSVVNYIDITRTYSVTAFTWGYSVGSPKLC